MAKQTFTTGQVLTAAQVNSLQTNDFNQTVSVKTAAYVLAAADKGTRIEFNTSGSVTCTVNTGLFDAGDTVIIQNRGAGTVTVTAGTATVDTSSSLALSQYSFGTLYFISSSSSIFFAAAAGDITGVTANSPLTGGGSSGSVSLGFDYAAGSKVTLNAQTGTTYTFVLADADQKLVTADSTSSQTYTLPPNSSVAFPTGSIINLMRINTGALALAQGSGVTIASTGATSTSPTLRARYSAASCIKVGTDSWYVVGDLA